MRRLRLLRNEELSPLWPPDGREFEFVRGSEPPFVDFSWSKNSLARSYSLEVARDGGFRDVVMRDDVFATTVASRFPAGRYFWRVSTSGEAGKRTAPRSFVVTERERLDPPEPLSPASGAVFSGVLFERQGALFNWRSRGSAAGAEILVERGDTSEEVFRGRVTGNFIRLKRSFAPGVYRWRVRSVDRRGEFTAFTEGLSFTVREGGRLSLLSPEEGKVFEVYEPGEGGVVFRWERASLGHARHERRHADADPAVDSGRARPGFHRLCAGRCRGRPGLRSARHLFR